jgi:hypothetical protein
VSPATLCPGTEHRALDMLRQVLGMSGRLGCKANGLAGFIYNRIPLAQTAANPMPSCVNGRVTISGLTPMWAERI